MSVPTDTPTTPAQARSIARHLIGEDPTPAELARWGDALATIAAPLERPRDRRLWQVATASATMAGLVDAGLALTEPYSPVRQRTCLMLAVLEASPAHVDRFEARPISLLGWAGIAVRGLVAAARSVCGLVLVRSWGVLWR